MDDAGFERSKAGHRQLWSASQECNYAADRLELTAAKPTGTAPCEGHHSGVYLATQPFVLYRRTLAIRRDRCDGLANWARCDSGNSVWSRYMRFV